MKSLNYQEILKGNLQCRPYIFTFLAHFFAFEQGNYTENSYLCRENRKRYGKKQETLTAP